MTDGATRLRVALYCMSDSRKALLKHYTGGEEPTLADVAAVSQFLKALSSTVAERKRTELRGLGVFEWRPWNGRLPTGRKVSTWRLVFKYRQKHGFVQKGRRK